jgi:Translation machinery associated TMA7
MHPYLRIDRYCIYSMFGLCPRDMDQELGAREGRSRCKIEDWQALPELASGRGPLNGGGIKSEATR